MSIFDKEFDRRVGNARKWSPSVIKEKFNIFSEDAIAMDLADIDFEVAPAIKRAVTERAKIGDYSYTHIPEEFYEAVISWNKRMYGLDFKKNEIKLTFGTVSTMYYIVQGFSCEGDGVMFHTPAYDPFFEAVKYNKRKAIYSPLIEKDGRYYMDFEQMEESFKKENIKLFILCNPQNPSGRIWDKEELARLSELCIKYEILIVSDEIHREFVYDKSKFTSLWSSHDNISQHSILCCSPNKAFNLGGLKTSYIVIKNEKIREKMLTQLQKNSITSPNVFAVPAIVAAYTQCDEWLEEMVKYVESNQRYIEKFIKDNMPLFDVMKAESSFLCWIKVDKLLKNDASIDEFFQKARICAVKGSYFVSGGENYVRLGIGMPKSMLIEALNRILKVYNEYEKNCR